MNLINIREVIARPEYTFLHKNERLRGHIMFVTFGGSHAYGTNVEGSDIDVRGCVAATENELLGLEKFEQFLDNQTDTTIYAFPKLIGLLTNCNPNTIELLGCRPDSYGMVSPAGRLLLDNAKLFLSQRCVKSFGGYAYQQLARLESAVAQRTPDAAEKERYILNACRSAMDHFGDRYQVLPEGGVRLRIGDGKSEPDEIVLDVDLHGYPLRDYRSMWREMNEIARNFGKLDQRNRKKDDVHLAKHMMHLIRLYLMCLDILEQEEIVTHREKDRELLMSIRNGAYMDADGRVIPEFYDLLHGLQGRFEYAKNNTSLPKEPDMKRINELTVTINKMSIGL